ncbi:hypothetical protein HYV10_02490 [Candidatus Dependentiae bacterium]|nr:hypothetical protein [Candidatus Dependentiae bacterium]
MMYKRLYLFSVGVMSLGLVYSSTNFAASFQKNIVYIDIPHYSIKVDKENKNNVKDVRATLNKYFDKVKKDLADSMANIAAKLKDNSTNIIIVQLLNKEKTKVASDSKVIESQIEIIKNALIEWESAYEIFFSDDTVTIDKAIATINESLQRIKTRDKDVLDNMQRMNERLTIISQKSQAEKGEGKGLNESERENAAALALATAQTEEQKSKKVEATASTVLQKIEQKLQRTQELEDKTKQEEKYLALQKQEKTKGINSETVLVDFDAIMKRKEQREQELNKKVRELEVKELQAKKALEEAEKVRKQKELQVKRASEEAEKAPKQEEEDFKKEQIAQLAKIKREIVQKDSKATNLYKRIETLLKNIQESSSAIKVQENLFKELMARINLNRLQYTDEFFNEITQNIQPKINDMIRKAFNSIETVENSATKLTVLQQNQNRWMKDFANPNLDFVGYENINSKLQDIVTGFESREQFDGNILSIVEQFKKALSGIYSKLLVTEKNNLKTLKVEPLSVSEISSSVLPVEKGNLEIKPLSVLGISSKFLPAESDNRRVDPVFVQRILELAYSIKKAK